MILYTLFMNMDSMLMCMHGRVQLYEYILLLCGYVVYFGALCGKYNCSLENYVLYIIMYRIVIFPTW